MTTSSNTEIQQLKEFIDNRFNQLDRKIDEVKAELKEDINQLDKQIIEIKADIKGIDKRLSTVETSIQKIPDLAEKVGEFKNWKQIGVLLLASIFSGTIGSFIGWVARSGKL